MELGRDSDTGGQ
ncbi:hypothetical protein A2U01_0100377, partial [Trifolium medium]|nr:hypothetical protein [Trifolium medium]MCI79106.1 hypothetical protein [Trifolium medium]